MLSGIFFHTIDCYCVKEQRLNYKFCSFNDNPAHYLDGLQWPFPRSQTLTPFSVEGQNRPIVVVLSAVYLILIYTFKCALKLQMVHLLGAMDPQTTKQEINFD